MAYRKSGSGPRLRLRLPVAGVRLLAALTCALLPLASCSADPEPAADVSARPTTPASASTAPAPPAAEEEPSCRPPCRGTPRTVGSFPVKQAAEASGLVASRRHRNVLYVLDDGPQTTGVLAISARNARVRGTLRISGLTGFDTEALAAGPCSADGGDCIYIGDIGDNLAQRDTITIYRFAEPPTIGTSSPTVEGQRIDLAYPDGPHNAEALLVDDAGTIGIVTKDAGRGGRGGARLYTAPEFADATLTLVGRVKVPQPRLPLVATVLGNVVTGADAAPGRVLLRTYDTVFEYVSGDAPASLAKFRSWKPTEVEVLSEPQGEAVAYGHDGCSVYTVSEDSGDLNVVPCKK